MASKSKPKAKSKPKSAKRAAPKTKAPAFNSASSNLPPVRTPPVRPGPRNLPGKAPVKFEPLPEGTVLKSKLPAKELQAYRESLLKLRDRIVDEISFLANDSLNRSQKDSSGDLSSYSFHMADQGTDNFDREFAANLLSSEQDVLYEIDEALRRIEMGTYGICEISGRPIEKERLKVLPFARYCVAVQSEKERGKPRFRPFRRTSIQTAETVT